MAFRAARQTDAGSGEQLVWLVPHNYRHDGTKPVVVHCHYRGGSELEALDYSSAGGYTSKPIYAMVAAGYPVVVPNLGGPTTWGNDTAITRVGQAITFAQAAPVKAKAGKVFVSGTSMGFLAACNWARQNAASCLGIIGMIYDFDLQASHDILQGGAFATEIETAYGGLAAYQAALPTHSPAVYGTTDLKGIPMLLIYSTDENPVANSQAQASFASSMQAATTSTVQAFTQTGGHSFQNFDSAPIGPFMRNLG